MIINPILKLRYLKPFLPLLKLQHTPTCPTNVNKSSEKQSVVKCGGSGTTKSVPGPKRQLTGGAVRMAFLPEEWFVFFYNKTGVSGPYVLGIVLWNYLFSKEIYVMEHEYYTGLSILIMIVYVNVNHGHEIAEWLDKEVDAHEAKWKKIRQDEKNLYLAVIKDAKDAQWRAEGQKLLMDAKKENISMQLEAIYRERIMQVHRMVKGRLDYQLKSQRVMARIQQKLMYRFIIDNVMKEITKEFKENFFKEALKIIASLAAKHN